MVLRHLSVMLRRLPVVLRRLPMVLHRFSASSLGPLRRVAPQRLGPPNINDERLRQGVSEPRISPEDVMF